MKRCDEMRPTSRAGRQASSPPAARTGWLACTLAARLAACALAAQLAACGASSPAPVLLTLPVARVSADAQAAPAPAGGTASAPVLAVRRIAIPEYMVARRVRYRADPSTLAEWPNTYWGERIEIGVSREFVSALRQQLPGWSVCETGCADQSPALTLQIDLTPMDYLRDAKSLQASARFTVSDGSATARVLRTDERAYALAGSADTAQAEAEAIAELIRRVARDAAPLVVAARP